MFKKPHEVTEGELLRAALKHRDTTVTVTGPLGERWVFCNDTAAECKLGIKDIVITEPRDTKDILIDFWVRATNGRLG